MTIESYLRHKAEQYGGRAVLVGKGPSFREFDPTRYADHFVVGINEASLKCRCDAAFMVDIDVLQADVEQLLANVGELILPRVMHKRRDVGGLALYGPSSTPTQALPQFRTGDTRFRLFNLATVEADPALGAAYPAHNFSAPTLANLLGASGFRRIVLAGIDGGTDYSSDFSELEYKKLKSVQSSYDVQFKDLRAVQRQWSIDFASVRCARASILIGAESEQALAEEVLKWSIDSNSLLSINYVAPSSESRSLYADGAVGTPFSLQRLFLPRMAGHVGRGAYFDSDMLVFRDVYELFNAPMGDDVLLNCLATPGRPSQYSVFVVDNERAQWNPDELIEQFQSGTITYADLIGTFAFVKRKAQRLPRAWNSLESYETGVTANIHYTDMGTQPWLNTFNRNAALWCESLLLAMAESEAVRKAFDVSVSNGWIRPSLIWQVENGKSDPWALPRGVRRMDREWLPPHMRARSSDGPTRLLLLKWRMASRVRRAMQSRSYVRIQKLGHAIRKAF